MVESLVCISGAGAFQTRLASSSILICAATFKCHIYPCSQGMLELARPRNLFNLVQFLMYDKDRTWSKQQIRIKQARQNLSWSDLSKARLATSLGTVWEIVCYLTFFPRCLECGGSLKMTSTICYGWLFVDVSFSKEILCHRRWNTSVREFHVGESLSLKVSYQDWAIHKFPASNDTDIVKDTPHQTPCQEFHGKISVEQTLQIIYVRHGALKIVLVHVFLHLLEAHYKNIQTWFLHRRQRIGYSIKEGNDVVFVSTCCCAQLPLESCIYLMCSRPK